MIFANRTVAGQQLADMLQLHLQRLDLFDKSDLLAVGLPRGGVPVALEIARKFGCPLDIIVSKKISLPQQKEYAIGAVTSDGVAVVNSALVESLHLELYVDQEKKRLLDHTKVLDNEFHVLANYPRSTFKNKIVVLVDDGIATGMTAVAAVESARRRGAMRIIIAAPVMSIESYNDLAHCCDDVLAVSLPEEFLAVGYHYSNFTQTSNEEVIKSLMEASQLAMVSEEYLSSVKHP